MSENHDSTPISELDESTSLNANDEFIISTKDSNEVYSSKKVKLSTVQNASPAAGITVKEEGTALATNATSLNFVGSTVTASGTGAEKTITITEPAGGGGGAAWSSGWQAVGASGAGTTKTLTHNLGTTDVVFALYVADDSSGTGACKVTSDSQAHDNGSWSFIGAQIRNLTSNQLYLQLGTHYSIWSATASVQSWNGKFFKVVAAAGGGGGGGAHLRKFTEHDTKTIKISCSTSEALAFVGPSSYSGINHISIVYAVGGSARQHYTVMSFSGRTKKLRTEGGTYTLTSSNQSIGRENDAYSILARYVSGVLYIETGASSYTSSQFSGEASDNNFLDTQFLVIDA